MKLIEKAGLIAIKHLSLMVKERLILNDIQLSIQSGKCVAIIGMSGAGKSSLLQLLGGINPGTILGSVTRFGEPIVTGFDPRVGWLPQGLADNLNPHMTIEQHLLEGLKLSAFYGKKKKLTHPKQKQKLKQEIERIIELVSLPSVILTCYPCHLSGGEIQRVLFALSLIYKPELLLLDEPTASLDSDTTSYISETLNRLKGQTTLVLVSHDFSLVQQLADRVIVMDGGRIIDEGTPCSILAKYDQHLNILQESDDIQETNTFISSTVLSIEYLSLRKRDRQLFSNFSMQVKRGETILTYGESGAGKTTLARILAGWDLPPKPCVVQHFGLCVYLSQHPRAACANHFSLREILQEPMKLANQPIDESSIKYWLQQVKLPDSDEFLLRKPATLSGGELQRLLIVRAMLAKPDVLIADEPTSALDPVLKQEIVECFKTIQEKTRCSLIIFTHDPELQELLCTKGRMLSEYGLETMQNQSVEKKSANNYLVKAC